ncbi:uncharacterized protein TNIN_429421 [Trichonephila inaurata madagascariensis]|uniref:Secreted protein n=1 Tax=Trichonephila inaurata madagascariensis TaxID=2747483 RepID=A0A8X7BTQ3_9ARAC|nr:uncharacterized protein TNIN_429421 [Trichonephila inaurata madagascariensis]
MLHFNLFSCEILIIELFLISLPDCNRTYYAEANIKTPLRMTTPFRRPLPYVCSMTFVAAGGEYGDIVQLTFLSFQIGALETDRYGHACFILTCCVISV